METPSTSPERREKRTREPRPVRRTLSADRPRRRNLRRSSTSSPGPLQSQRSVRFADTSDDSTTDSVSTSKGEVKPILRTESPRTVLRSSDGPYNSTSPGTLSRHQPLGRAQRKKHVRNLLLSPTGTLANPPPLVPRRRASLC